MPLYRSVLLRLEVLGLEGMEAQFEPQVGLGRQRWDQCKRVATSLPLPPLAEFPEVGPLLAWRSLDVLLPKLETA